MNIILFTSSETAQAHVSEAYRTLSQEQRNQLRIVIFDLNEASGGRTVAARLSELTTTEIDLVIFEAHGVRKETIDLVLNRLNDCGSQFVPVGNDSADIRSACRLGSLTGERLPDSGPAALRSVPADIQRDYANYVRMNEFWRGGGRDNMLGLLCLAGREYGRCDRLPEPADPVLLRELSIYDPSSLTCYSTASDYRSSRGYSGRRPTVALLFLANGNPQDIADCVGELMKRIEAFADVLPLAFPSVMHVPMETLRTFFEDEGSPVDLIVNLLPFRLGIGPTGVGSGVGGSADMLDALGAPMLHPFFLSGTTEAEWRQSVRGIAPSQLLVQIVLPELDGSIETYPIAALQPQGCDPELGVEINKLTLIPERANRLIGRIRRWLALREKPNRDKRLAVVCYNYPPGEANVFGGSFLDTFETVSRLLSGLKSQGYSVEDMTAEELRKRFVDGALVNSGRWSGETASGGMIRYADPSFPAKLFARPWGRDAEARWGPPPGEIMTEREAFLIPGIVNGRIFIGLQPSRGIHENPEQAVHDRALPPTHQYTAFYQWIRDDLEADAIIHIGTHGTLEFQLGKESGLSGACVPDDMIGELPHIYYYYVGNPSEAMIAKRRSHAVLIGYQAPPFAEAELYGEWAGLEALLHEYREAELLDPVRCKDILRRLRALAQSLHFAAETVEEMEEELYRMQRSLIPSGLHVLGEGYAPDDAAAYMQFVLRLERGGIRSLQGLLAERKGRNTGSIANPGNAQESQMFDQEAEAVIKAYLAEKTIPAEYQKEPREWREGLLAALAYGYHAFENSLANEEMKGLLNALEGRYIRPQLAGDAMRNPDVLPSGRNLYQFDPRAVPSLSAAERGALVAENSIRQYYELHGEYPETTAVVLWGLETSRTQGETIGQILRYMGIRLLGGSGALRPEYDIIPLAELGRPRLNVVVHMTGLFRDMFPNLLDDLNRLFQRISELDETEEQNRFRARTLQTERELSEAGYAHEQVKDLGIARIFGPAEGVYGTGVNRLIETKVWNTEAELGQAYAESQQHVYSLKARGSAEPKLFQSHLLAVDVVSQIRSSHEWEVTDSDHYYEYFGGLAKSVEMARGKAVEIHITDTTSDRIETESAEYAIARGIRTRIANPKWIEALLKHPYHGAQEIAKRFEYVLGLAATTGKVEAWVFDQMHETYVSDEARSRQMRENNRWAYHAMLETLLESGQREYWHPSEAQLEQLRQKYVELEGDLEGTD